MSKMVNIITNSTERTAVALLFGQIGYDFDGNEFAKELEELKNVPNLKSCKIKINSVGGNVFEGFSIMSVIDILNEKGIQIDTECVGVAYSMAGIILSCGKKRSIVNYGTVMIHDPKFGFGSPETEAQKNMLQKMTDSLSSIIQTNSKLTIEQVREYMIKESTFDAYEAVNNGLVDTIIQTGRKLEPMQDHYKQMVACSEIYNNNKPKQLKMKKLTDLLNLNAEASEDAIVGAVNVLIGQKTDIQALRDEKTSLENKVLLLTSENNTLKEKAVTSQAEALVNKAKEDGKFGEASVPMWLEAAKKDFDGTKKLIDGLTVAPVNLNTQIVANSTEASAMSSKYEELLANPKAMDAMDEKELKLLEDAWVKNQEKKFAVL